MKRLRRAACPECKDTFPVRKDGQLRFHLPCRMQRPRIDDRALEPVDPPGRKARRKKDAIYAALTAQQLVPVIPFPDSETYVTLACVGCGVEVGRTRLRYADRQNLFACDACQAIIKRFVTTMRARGYRATDLFYATFNDVPGIESWGGPGRGLALPPPR